MASDPYDMNKRDPLQRRLMGPREGGALPSDPPPYQPPKQVATPQQEASVRQAIDSAMSDPLGTARKGLNALTGVEGQGARKARIARDYTQTGPVNTGPSRDAAPLGQEMPGAPGVFRNRATIDGVEQNVYSNISRYDPLLVGAKNESQRAALARRSPDMAATVGMYQRDQDAANKRTNEGAEARAAAAAEAAARMWEAEVSDGATIAPWNAAEQNALTLANVDRNRSLATERDVNTKIAAAGATREAEAAATAPARAQAELLQQQFADAPPEVIARAFGPGVTPQKAAQLALLPTLLDRGIDPYASEEGRAAISAFSELLSGMSNSSVFEGASTPFDTLDGEGIERGYSDPTAFGVDNAPLSGVRSFLGTGQGEYQILGPQGPEGVERRRRTVVPQGEYLQRENLEKMLDRLSVYTPKE